VSYGRRDRRLPDGSCMIRAIHNMRGSCTGVQRWKVHRVDPQAGSWGIGFVKVTGMTGPDGKGGIKLIQETYRILHCI
jgi:hypothetical protein